MSFVVTESCINCKHTECVAVCPVDCFHEGSNFLVIDPEECIDCALCVARCPVNAIMEDRSIPEDMKHFIHLNAELAAIWPSLTRRQTPPPDAEEWAGVSDKLKLLER